MGHTPYTRLLTVFCECNLKVENLSHAGLLLFIHLVTVFSTLAATIATFLLGGRIICTKELLRQQYYKYGVKHPSASQLAAAWRERRRCNPVGSGRFGPFGGARQPCAAALPQEWPIDGARVLVLVDANMQ